MEKRKLENRHVIKISAFLVSFGLSALSTKFLDSFAAQFLQVYNCCCGTLMEEKKSKAQKKDECEKKRFIETGSFGHFRPFRTFLLVALLVLRVAD